jgi:hypothetical protein
MNSKIWLTNAEQILDSIFELNYDLKYNFEHGNINQKAWANLTRTVYDLGSSYLRLLTNDNDTIIFGRSIIIRSMLETCGNAKHILLKPKRAEEYMNYIEQITERTSKPELYRTRKIKGWTSSTVQQRISLISNEHAKYYDLLSDFAHGNNLQIFYSDTKLADAYIKFLNMEFCTLLADFIAYMAVILNLDAKLQSDILSSATQLLKSAKSIKA